MFRVNVPVHCVCQINSVVAVNDTIGIERHLDCLTNNQKDLPAIQHAKDAAMELLLRRSVRYSQR